MEIEKKRKYKSLTVEQYNKAYYEKNCERAKFLHNQRYFCECGKSVSFGSKSKHFLTKRHLKKILNNFSCLQKIELKMDTTYE